MKTKDEILSLLSAFKERSKFLKPIAEFIENNLLEDIDIDRTKVFLSEEALSMDIFPDRKNAIPIVIVLWLGEEQRVTFFIEDNEIFDDYLKDTNDVEQEISFLRNLLSNEIVKVIYSRNGETKKIIYKYHLLGNDGNSTICEDKFTVKPSFFWNKNEKSAKVYQPWIF